MTTNNNNKYNIKIILYKYLIGFLGLLLLQLLLLISSSTKHHLSKRTKEKIIIIERHQKDNVDTKKDSQIIGHGQNVTPVKPSHINEVRIDHDTEDQPSGS